MYPLNVSNAKIGGFAVANSEDEHKALTEMGYEPKFVAPELPAADEPTLESVRAELDAAGIAYDKRVKDVAKLQALLPAA
jgi:hypothetical protein